MRLAIGTAQFGMPYGISNNSGQTSGLEAKKILDMAFAGGVDTLDTAVNYGDCEANLGKFGVMGWNVISKIPPIPVGAVGDNGWVLKHVKASLVNLKLEQLDGVLLHAPEQVLGPDGGEIIEGLGKAKSLGLVKKIGYSIYSPELLPSLFVALKPDIVQLPLNIFDQRAVNTGWLTKMVDLGVEIHVRSVFLQGLLLMSPAQRPAYFSRWHELFQQWDTMVADKNALETCLGFVKSLHGIAKVVVGVESQAQLSQLLSAWNKAVSYTAPQLSCRDEALINPSNWTTIS